METETWKPIPGYDRYEVSDLGRVRSWYGHGRCARAIVQQPRILKANPDVNGYARLNLVGPTRTWECHVHRLVLLVFVGPCPPGLLACHADDHGMNNRLDNLRWGTIRDNQIDKERNGRVFRGERCRKAKLSNQQVIDIRTLAANGATSAELAERFSVPSNYISRITLGAIWKSIGGPIRPQRHFKYSTPAG
jgi:hypothetical protein